MVDPSEALAKAARAAVDILEEILKDKEIGIALNKKGKRMLEALRSALAAYEAGREVRECERRVIKAAIVWWFSPQGNMDQTIEEYESAEKSVKALLAARKAVQP